MKLKLVNPSMKLHDTGFGSAGHNFAMHLMRLGVQLLRFDWEPKADAHLYFGLPYRLKGWGKYWLKRQADVYGIFTMCEAEILPAGWVEDINNTFDFVIVPSTFCKTHFEKNGIEKPVFVVPLGVEPSQFPFLRRPPDRKRLTIIWQGTHVADRKGRELLVQAREDLKLTKEIRLIIKFMPIWGWAKRAAWELLFDDFEICDRLPHAVMLMLLQEADVSFNPTQAEGFGLLPLEHMATGLPTFVSETSGCLDYRDVRFNVGIECTRQKNFYGEQYGEIERPTLQSVTKALGWLYEQHKEHAEWLKRIGPAASEWVHENWNYAKQTRKLHEVLMRFT